MQTSHFDCVIFKHTKRGPREIPASVWVDLARALRDTFGATMHLHDQCCDGGGRDLQLHYFVEVVLEGTHSSIGPILQFIEPRLNAIADQYTTPYIVLGR